MICVRISVHLELYKLAALDPLHPASAGKDQDKLCLGCYFLAYKYIPKVFDGTHKKHCPACNLRAAL